MSTYDKIVHGLGQAALSITGYAVMLGVGNGPDKSGVPKWLVITCLAVTAFAGLTTNAVFGPSKAKSE